MSACSVGDLGFISGSGGSPGEEMTIYPSILPEDGQRSLVGYSPCGCKESVFFFFFLKDSVLTERVTFNFIHILVAVEYLP